MKYITWSLIWKDGYGYGPEALVAENGARLESAHAKPGVANGTILGYLTGDLDLSLLSDWNVVELTQDEALAFVQQINSEASVDQDGFIVLPVEEEY